MKKKKVITPSPLCFGRERMLCQTREHSQHLSQVRREFRSTDKSAFIFAKFNEEAI